MNQPAIHAAHLTQSPKAMPDAAYSAMWPAHRRMRLRLSIAVIASILLFAISVFFIVQWVTASRRLSAAATELQRQRAESAEIGARADAEHTAREKSDQELESVRQSIDAVYQTIASNSQLKATFVAEARVQLLTQAQQYYQKYVARCGDEPALAREMARALHRLAVIHKELGAKEKALAASKQSLQLLEAMLGQTGDPQLQDLMIDGRCFESQLLISLGRSFEAIGVAANAVAAIESSRNAHSDLIQQERLLAASLIMLDAQQQAGATDSAAVTLKRVTELSDRLAASVRTNRDAGVNPLATASPNGAIAFTQVLLHFEKLANEVSSSRDASRANAEKIMQLRQFVRDAAPRLEQSLAASPKNPLLRQISGRLHHRLGAILAESILTDTDANGSQRKEGITHLRKAVDIRRELMKDLRTATQPQVDLLGSLQCLAHALRDAETRDDALAAFNEAIALSTDLATQSLDPNGAWATAFQLRRERSRLLLDEKRFAVAMPYLEEHLTLLRKEGQRFSRDPASATEYRRQLALVLGDLGTVLRSLGRNMAAKKHLQDALTLIDGANDRPTSAAQRTALAAILTSLAMLCEPIEADQAERHFRRASDLQRGLLLASPADSVALRNLETTTQGLCRLLSSRQQWQLCLDQVREIVSLMQLIREREPDHWQVVHTQSRLGMDLAQYAVRAGQTRLALDAFAEAKTHLELLAKRFPDSTALQDDLADTLLQFGSLVWTSAPTQPQSAIALMRAGVHVCRERTAKVSGDAVLARRLIDGLTALAIALSSQKEHVEAERLFVEAISMLDKQAASHGNDAAYSRAAIVGPFSEMLWELPGRADAAIELATRVLTQSESALRDAPAELRSRIAPLWRVRAAAYHRSGRIKESLADWDQALEFAADTQRTSWQFGRLATLARTENYSSAVGEADRLIKGVPISMQSAYEVSCIYAVAAQSAVQDTSRLESERQLQEQEYANAALAYLRVAVGKGYRNTSNLRRDKHLDNLTGRADFQVLLRDMERK
jgi:hypothetical protein